jgi:hypothetical protein
MFTYKYYKLLIKTLQERGYEFSSFEYYNPLKTVYLRHDVDMDIFGVLPLAEVENSSEVKSIWFFQPDNDVYNMLNRHSLGIISRLTDMGHQVGLLIDASIYQGYESLNGGIKLLFDFYKNYIPLSGVIAFYRPSPYLIGNSLLRDFISTYEDRFFNDIAYVSDNNRREFWKEEQLFEAIKAGSSIQLQINPVWWKELLHSREAVLEYLWEKVKASVAESALKINCKIYNN